MGTLFKNYDGAVEMYGKGLSIEEVAAAFGVSRQSMWKTLRRRGVTFRPQIRRGEDSKFYRGGVVDKRIMAITKAVEKGILTPQPCEVCGLKPKLVFRKKQLRQRIEAHHDDYNHPLKVRWLCKVHHHQWHKKNKPIPLDLTIPRPPKRLTEEHKRKVGAASKGRMPSPEARAKMSQAKKGKPFSPAFIAAVKAGKNRRRRKLAGEPMPTEL